MAWVSLGVMVSVFLAVDTGIGLKEYRVILGFLVAFWGLNSVGLIFASFRKQQMYYSHVKGNYKE